MSRLSDPIAFGGVVDSSERRDELVRLALSSLNARIWQWHIASEQVGCAESLLDIAALGDPTFSILAADAASFDQHISAAIQSGGNLDFQFRIFSVVGVTKSFRVTGKILRDEQSRPSQIVGLIFEVAQSASKQQNEFISNLLDILPDPIFVKDREHRWIYGNREFTNLLKMPSEKFVGKSDYDIFPKEMADHFWVMDNEVFEFQLSNEIEEEIVLPDTGEMRKILTKKTPYTDESGREYLIGIIRDITSRKQDEEMMQNLVSLISASSDFVGYGDLAGKPIFLNKKARAMLGFEEHGVLDDVNIISYYSELVSEGIKSSGLENTWEGERTLENKKTGEKIPVLLRVFPLRDSEGMPKFAAVVAIDLRSKKQAEMTLFHSSRLASLGEMAGGIAHEINNPLAIIHGRAALLLKNLEAGKVDPIRFKDGLIKVMDTVDRISKIVRGMKAVARNSENDPFIRASWDQIVDDTLELCRERIKNNGVEFKLYVTTTNSVECRSSQLSQVLLNLLNNSLDAIEGSPSPWITVQIAEVGSDFEISIEDSGSGIPESLRAKIMDPFFTTKELGKGTGLGLSISKGIIEDHQGRLFIDERSAHTKFVIRIPLQRSKPHAAK